jgi:signal transduction histidine kinase
MKLPLVHRLTPGSLRWRFVIPLVVVGTLCAVFGATVVIITYSQQLNLHMQKRGEAIAASIDATIRDILHATDQPVATDTLRQYISDLGTLPDVTLVVVVSGDPARVAASTNPEWVGLLLTDLPYDLVQKNLFDAIETRRMHPDFLWETMEYDVSWPLALDIEHRPRGTPDDGAIMLHLDARPVRAQSVRAAVETTGALMLAILAMGGMAWLLVDRMFIHRIGQIEATMSYRSSGEAAIFAPELGGDEIGRLSSSFNTMLRALDDGEARLQDAHDHLEEQVLERTEDLATTNDQLRIELNERERAEEALLESHARLRRADRMATIGAMAAGVAHDLNNLLLPIRLRLHVLDTDSATDEQKEASNDLRQSVRFLQQLAQSLRLCVVDPADATEEVPETRLDQWWEQVGSLLSKAFRTRTNTSTAHVEVTIPSKLPPVAVSSHRLTQALLNLVINAGDASQDKQSSVLKITASMSDVGDNVIIRVTDNGCGMTSEVLHSAFDPFFTTKPRGASTGLGLSIVHGIAESSGGSVEVQSTLGTGTTILLCFPVVTQTGPVQKNARTVAVTLDDDRLVSYVATALYKEGMQVATVSGETSPQADVWVLSPVSIQIDIVHQFLLVDPRRGVVIIGARPLSWEDLRAECVSVYADSEEILEATARCMNQGSDD